MSDLECDVAVIGAGTAGLSAERHARKAGARTLLIDEGFAGTTCATVGCMPSKLLIAAGDAAHAVHHAANCGVKARAEVDGVAVFRRLRAERDRFVDGVLRSIEKIPGEVRVTARASFCAPDRLELDDGRRVTARAIVIATGSSPAIPGAFDAVSDLILTNRNIFELEDLPGSVAVIGAGPIGLELGQALARLGVRVEVFDMGDTVGGQQDRDVSKRLHEFLQREIPIHLSVEPEIARDPGGVRVTCEGHSQVFDRLLVAAGRPADLDTLNLGAAGIATDDRGLPEVDPQTLQIGDSRVFVAGDANSDRPLLHEAAHEGTIAGQNAARYPDVRRFERLAPMAITFTRPESATVGHVPDPEDTDHACAEASYDDQGRARVEARTGGLCRLYARRADGRLIGASLCAPDAAHLAHLLGWAIEARLRVADLLGMPFYHPTLEEGLKPAFRDLCAQIGEEGDASRGDSSPCS